MYIPTIFFGAQNDCIECLFSGSVIPDGVVFDKLNSDWVYIKIPAGKEVAFQTKTGVSSNAKMLVVGGGGYTSGIGGAGAGQVIFQDFGIQPDILYYASASIGGRSSSPIGQSSVFIENYTPDPVNWRKHTAVGGDDNNSFNGGDSGNGYIGGTGISGVAGGGGAGSTGNGDNATGGGSPIAGDGGGGYAIPSPFNTAVGFNLIAGGGPGSSIHTNGSYTVPPSAYGNGGANFGNQNNGNDGTVFIFLPITNCETGSREDLDFIAEGGSTGTFYSGSVQYKYHVFTQTSSSLGGTDTFNVIQGVTHEAKTFVIGGGAGSSTRTFNYSYGGGNKRIQSGGGAGAGGVKINENVTLWGYSNKVYTGEGGPRYTNGYRSTLTPFPTFAGIYADGGGRGSYENANFNPGSGDANNGGSGGGGLFVVDNTGGTATGNGLGNSGGNGYGSPVPYNSYGGGGGGGATSAGTVAGPGGIFGNPGQEDGIGGSGYDLAGTFWSFLTGSVYTSRSDVAIGGSGSANFFSESTTGTAPLRPNGSQANDGSGADPVDNRRGNSGIIVIAYPISGSVNNS